MIKLGYFKDSADIDLDDETIMGLTNLNYSFAKVIDKKGTVSESWKNIDKLALVREKHTTLICSLAIGGWGAGNFSEAAESKENRENFVRTSLEIVKKYNFDGIDMDWEYPCVPGGGISAHPNDKQNFTKLMSEIRKGLDALGGVDGKTYILTFAAGATNSYVNNVELDKLSEITDFMNLMTYDMSGSFTTTGHQTSIYASEITDQVGADFHVRNFDKHGYPMSKIVFGCAFYGRGGNKVVAMDQNETGICSRIYGEQGLYFDYHEIIELLKDPEYKEYYDEKAVAAYAYNGDTFITYDTPQTIKLKMQYVTENNLAGIMYWEHQTDKTRTLIKEII